MKEKNDFADSNVVVIWLNVQDVDYISGLESECGVCGYQPNFMIVYYKIIFIIMIE